MGWRKTYRGFRDDFRHMAYAPIGAIEPEVNQVLKFLGSKRRLNEQNLYQFLDDQESNIRRSIRQPFRKKQKISEPQKKRKVDPDMPAPVRGFQNFDSGHACVEVKSVNLKGYGRPAWKGDPQMLKDPEMFEDYQQQLLISNRNSERTQPIGPEFVTLATDAAGSLSRTSFQPPRTTNFNSIGQLETYRSELGSTVPEYSTSNVTELVSFPRDAKAIYILDNQRLDMRFKNLTANTSTGSGASLSVSPVYCDLKFFQAKRDIYLQEPSALKDQFATWINGGFSMAYDGDQKLGGTPDHPPGKYWKENTFLKDNFNIIQSRKFVLNAGQEACLAVYLNTKQCLSTKYQLKNTLVGTGPNLYNAVFIKKGEIRMVIKTHGGLTLTTGNVACIEETQLACYMHRRFNAYRLQYDNNIMRRNANLTVTAGAAITNDLDVAHLDNL